MKTSRFYWRQQCQAKYNFIKENTRLIMQKLCKVPLTNLNYQEMVIHQIKTVNKTI